MSTIDKRPLKVFLCHIMPVGYAHADRDRVRALPAGARLTKDGVDAWLDKAKLLLKNKDQSCIIELVPQHEVLSRRRGFQSCGFGLQRWLFVFDSQLHTYETISTQYSALSFDGRGLSV
jgi:hypothetical protein